jgi:hypothetical protein
MTMRGRKKFGKVKWPSLPVKITLPLKAGSKRKIVTLNESSDNILGQAHSI